MNCFEARQEFPAFWRRELAANRKSLLIDHLANCSKCDRAFRNFALSAPVLHSVNEPLARGATQRRDDDDSHARRAPAVSRNGFSARRRFATSAAAMALIAASIAAYLSVTIPLDNLNDELSADPGSAQMLGTDLSPASEDLAG
jgi:predicted anti-sigma-YlaC factor YlaD